jgi:hypothetical protein
MAKLQGRAGARHHTVGHCPGTGEIHPACHKRGRVAGRVKRLVEQTIKRLSTRQDQDRGLSTKGAEKQSCSVRFGGF